MTVKFTKIKNIKANHFDVLKQCEKFCLNWQNEANSTGKEVCNYTKYPTMQSSCDDSNMVDDDKR